MDATTPVGVTPTDSGPEPQADTIQRADAGWGDFFPLRIGNQWRYGELLNIQIVDLSGNPMETFVAHSDITRELIGTEVLFDREYIVERETGVQVSELGENAWTYWARYRQDRSGLYEADVMLSDPPGPEPARAEISRTSMAVPALPQSLARLSETQRVAWRDALQRIEARRARLRELFGSGSDGAGGPLANELTRLRYPLHVGATWKIRNDPDLVTRGVVEKHEILRLPAGRFPAWRIRIIWDVPDFDDTILVWYGPSGFLKLRFHAEDQATTPEGDPIGLVISDEIQQLRELQIGGPRRTRHEF